MLCPIVSLVVSCKKRGEYCLALGAKRRFHSLAEKELLELLELLELPKVESFNSIFFDGKGTTKRKYPPNFLSYSENIPKFATSEENHSV